MRLILELSLVFALWMGLTDYYIYRQYVRYWKQRWAKYAYAIPGLLLLVSMIVIFGNFGPNSNAMHQFCMFLIVFLCIYVPKLLFTLLSLLFKPICRWTHETWIAGSISLMSMAYLIFGATVGIEHFQVKEEVICSSDIPEAFDGYRIIHLSDMHVGSWNKDTDAMKKAVSLINTQKADLILFTGDLVNNIAEELNEFIPVLSQLESKDGVYSVLGNHDYAMYIPWESEEAKSANLVSLKEKQAQMGWILLVNQHVKLHQGNDSIALIGVENSGRPPFPDYAKLSEAMAGTEGMFKILLSHDPTHWKREVLPDTDIHLTLSGHTHAMQTKIFGFTPAAFIFDEHSGLYQEGDQYLYVNIGLGHLMFPMRLGAWPEITLLTLRRAK